MKTTNHTYGGPERRAFVRIPFEAMIQVKKILPSQEERQTLFRDVKSKNISGSGVLIKSKEHFELGTLLELEFSVPTEEGYSDIQIHGKVVRVVPRNGFYDNGIVFHKIKKKDEKAIANLVEFLQDEEE